MSQAPCPWDAGIEWHLSEPGTPPDSLELAFVRDDVLKLPSTDADNRAIARYIAASTRMAQRATLRALVDQTYQLRMSAFPGGHVSLPWPPLIAIVSFTYIDAAGAEQTLAAGTGYQLSAPAGAMARNAHVHPPAGGAWPSCSSSIVDPVRITYRAGYVNQGVSPTEGEVPADIIEGQLQVIGEMYKQRSETIVGFGISVTPAVINARSLWAPYAMRVYR